MNNQPTTASFALVTKNAFAINYWERTHHRFPVCVVVTIDILRRVPIGPLDAIMGLDLDVAVTISNYGAVIEAILSYHIRRFDRYNLDTADGGMWHDCVRWHMRGICRSGAFEIGGMTRDARSLHRRTPSSTSTQPGHATKYLI